MAIPKTNLFRGDRVKFSKSYINGQRFVESNRKDGTGGGTMLKKNYLRIGIIVNDTLDPKQDTIRVKWDGNSNAHRRDEYMPVDLELVEDEEGITQ